MCPRSEFVLVHSKAGENTRKVRYSGKILNIDRSPIATSEDLAEVLLSKEYDVNAVLLKYSPAATERLTRATTRNSGARFAFLVNEKVLLYIKWEGEFGLGDSGMQLSLRNEKLAKRTADALKSCIQKPLDLQ